MHVFIAPAYSKVRYRGSTFHPFVRSSVRPSVHNLCQGAYSVAVKAGSMKPCIQLLKAYRIKSKKFAAHAHKDALINETFIQT